MESISHNDTCVLQCPSHSTIQRDIVGYQYKIKRSFNADVGGEVINISLVLSVGDSGVNLLYVSLNQCGFVGYFNTMKYK